jgi:hypothetical protein
MTKVQGAQLRRRGDFKCLVCGEPGSCSANKREPEGGIAEGKESNCRQTWCTQHRLGTPRTLGQALARLRQVREMVSRRMEQDRSTEQDRSR